MKVICESFRRCKSVVCPHRKEHEKDSGCGEGTCARGGTAECIPVAIELAGEKMIQEAINNKILKRKGE